MNVEAIIKLYITSQPEQKSQDMQSLHLMIHDLMPHCKLRYFDGKNEAGKIVTNPNIGYGNYTIKYKDGTTKDFYQIGMSANTTGISVYVMGINDKKYLPQTFGAIIGKASITGYCIKFKTLKDINIEVLLEAIRYGFERTELNH